VRAAQGGDGLALDALLRRHHDRILGVCRRMAGNEADALDATQDALIAIARGLRRFDGRSAFSTWAYRVATNACLDELRRRRRRPRPGLPEDFEAARVDDLRPSTGLAGATARPSAAIEGLPDRLAVDAALAELADDLRAAVVLRDLCDLDYAEIASSLGIPPGTVRSRISRGRAQLARLLEPRNQPAAPDRPISGSASPPTNGPPP
jgi:RNA polymerase sigma-70 factor (ECF subfamily)